MNDVALTIWIVFSLITGGLAMLAFRLLDQRNYYRDLNESSREELARHMMACRAKNAYWSGILDSRSYRPPNKPSEPN